mgnify:CR=1 FL=1
MSARPRTESALALALAQEGERSLSHLAGTFTTKRVRGADYVYFQYSDPGGGKRQFSVGRQSERVDSIVRDYERIHDEMRTAYRAAGQVAFGRLCALLPGQDFGRISSGNFLKFC